MTFWLRENAGHSSIIAAPVRFTIGRRTYSGSVAGLQNRFDTRILMGGEREGQTERILLKMDPKPGMNKRVRGDPGQWKSTSKGTKGYSAELLMAKVNSFVTSIACERSGRHAYPGSALLPIRFLWADGSRPLLQE